MTFLAKHKTLTKEEALAFAAELEAALGKVLNLEIKPNKLPIEPMVALISYVRQEPQ